MQQSANKPVAVPPLWTLAMMGLAVVSALALVDWANTGTAKPGWMFFLPAIFGVVGAVIALRKHAYLPAVISVLLGLAALPLLNFVITLLYGP